MLERLLSEASRSTVSMRLLRCCRPLESVVLPASEPESGVHVAPRARRARAREQGAEGRLWPVVIALGLLALGGFRHRMAPSVRAAPPCSQPLVPAVRWCWLQRPLVSVPSAELDQRQQLFSRLRALQVDRGWFVELVDASQLSTEPQQNAAIQQGLDRAGRAMAGSDCSCRRRFGLDWGV